MSGTISVTLSQEESPSTEETREASTGEAQMMGRLCCLLLVWTSMESSLEREY